MKSFFFSLDFSRFSERFDKRNNGKETDFKIANLHVLS